jgi:hypothetical protein
MPSRHDDLSIHDETILWRRVNSSPPMMETDAGGNVTLTSFAFKAPQDELSMDISTETTQERVLAMGFPGQKLVGIEAGVLRRLGYLICRDPEPNDPAHVLVLPHPGKSKNQKREDRKRMALAARLC